MEPEPITSNVQNWFTRRLHSLSPMPVIQIDTIFQFPLQSRISMVVLRYGINRLGNSEELQNLTKQIYIQSASNSDHSDQSSKYKIVEGRESQVTKLRHFCNSHGTTSIYVSVTRRNKSTKLKALLRDDRTQVAQISSPFYLANLGVNTKLHTLTYNQMLRTKLSLKRLRVAKETSCPFDSHWSPGILLMISESPGESCSNCQEL